MMTENLKDFIGASLNRRIQSIKSVSGGDISRAYLLSASDERFFCKINNKHNSLDMFQKEAKGLQLMASTGSVRIPEVFGVGTHEGDSFLILEFIESKRPSKDDSIRLAERLSTMHSYTAENFGLDHDNYIGSLEQFNSPRNEWSEFYLEKRLHPQFKWALDSGMLSSGEIPNDNIVLKRLSEIFKEIKPSLIHGDLWSGNYMIDIQGNPVLIDPAVYYGHSEVDIAMSRLFGGFDAAFYQRYFELRTPFPGLEERIDIYQLYYLLVHLNLFGSSYYGSVKRILKRYF